MLPRTCQQRLLRKESPPVGGQDRTLEAWWQKHRFRQGQSAKEERTQQQGVQERRRWEAEGVLSRQQGRLDATSGWEPSRVNVIGKRVRKLWDLRTAAPGRARLRECLCLAGGHAQNSEKPSGDYNGDRTSLIVGNATHEPSSLLLTLASKEEGGGSMRSSALLPGGQSDLLSVCKPISENPPSLEIPTASPHVQRQGVNPPSAPHAYKRL